MIGRTMLRTAIRRYCAEAFANGLAIGALAGAGIVWIF